MTKTDRVKTLQNAVYCVRKYHPLDAPHTEPADDCKCVYGQTLKNLAEMLKEARRGPKAL